MAVPVTLIPQNLDPNVCYANEQQRFNDFVQHIQAIIAASFTPVVVSSTAPGPDQRGDAWINVDGNNAIQDVETFSNGAWNGLPKPWITGEFKVYDPTLYSPASPWRPCDGSVTGVPDLRGRILIATGQRQLPAGSTDTATNFAYGQTGGAETTMLTASNLPAHAHTLFSKNQGVQGTDQSNEVLPRNSPPNNNANGGYISGGNTTGSDSNGNPLPPIPAATLDPYYAAAIMQWRPDLP